MEDGAESPCAQHRFSKAYGNYGRIHANPEQSDVTMRSCPGPAALATQCCAYARKPAAEPVLVLLHLEKLP